MNNSMDISIAQAKLLANSLRAKIIYQLHETPLTAKQVADKLGESGGNVHYHIKKLHEGELLDLVEERKVGGVIEKYYKSKALWFNSNHRESLDPALYESDSSPQSSTLSTRLSLSTAEKQELNEDIKALVEKWLHKTSVHKDADVNRQEYSIGIKIVPTERIAE